MPPKSNNAPFIVQPPPDNLRDRLSNSDDAAEGSVVCGYDEDFVRTVDAQTLLQAASCRSTKRISSGSMKRQTTDYFLRVVVPLASF